MPSLVLRKEVTLKSIRALLSQQVSLSLIERLNGQGPCPDKEAPGPDKNASTAKRRRSLTAEVEGIAPLSSFQKEFMDHRNEIRNMLDNYMASLHTTLIAVYNFSSSAL